jgi:hypothetical protein
MNFSANKNTKMEKNYKTHHLHHLFRLKGKEKLSISAKSS